MLYPHNTINITLSEYATHDKLRVLYLSDYFGDNLMICASAFESPDRIAENFGFLMTFWVGQDINERTKLDELKQAKKIKYFFYNDQ